MRARVFSLFFFLGFVGFGLVGCAKTSYYYSKSGVSDTQMESDSYQCHKENRYKKTNVYYDASSNYGFVNTTEKTNRAMWTKCMRARGYTVTTKSRSSYTQPTKYVSPSYNHVWCASKKHGVFFPPDINTCEMFGGKVFSTESQAKAEYDRMSWE